MPKTRSMTSPIPSGRSVTPAGWAGMVGCTRAMLRARSTGTRLLGSCLRESDAPLQPRERPRRPPVEVAEEPHRRGHDERTYERRVDRDRDCHAEADRLDQDE